MNRTFEELEELVLSWAEARQLRGQDYQSTLAQALKMVSEVGELADGIVKRDGLETVDGIGDVLVTVIILADKLGYDPTSCLESAYREISDRTGETVNGVFIKNHE